MKFHGIGYVHCEVVMIIPFQVFSSVVEQESDAHYARLDTGTLPDLIGTSPPYNI